MKIRTSTLVIIMGFFIKVIIVGVYSGPDSTYLDHITFGKDEARYLDLSSSLALAVENEGIRSILSNYYTYTQSYHVGNYFFLALIMHIFGNLYMPLVIVKGIILSFGIYYFGKWIGMRFGSRATIFSVAALILYIPLQFFSTSLMRDDLIFSGMAYALYAFERHGNVRSGIAIALVAAFRINAAIALFACKSSAIFISNFNRRRLRRLCFYLAVICFLCFVILLRFDYIRGQIFTLIQQLNPVNVFVNLVRLVLSPLPWELDPTLPLMLRLWYIFSFFISVTCGIYFLISCVIKKYIFDLSLFIFFGAYVLPYILVNNLGFRQVASIVPFMALPVMVKMFGMDEKRGKDNTGESNA